MLSCHVHQCLGQVSQTDAIALDLTLHILYNLGSDVALEARSLSQKYLNPLSLYKFWGRATFRMTYFQFLKPLAR